MRTKPEYLITYPAVCNLGTYYIGNKHSENDIYDNETGEVERRTNDLWVFRHEYIEYFVNRGWELLQIIPKVEPLNKHCAYEYLWVKR